MLEKLTQPVQRLREKKELREDLEAILETPHGQRFFKVFLKHCGVTRSTFSNDPMKIVADEATRRLAMSYLQILGKDDPQHLITMIEDENNQRHNPE
jgi:hypothetical protein